MSQETTQVGDNVASAYEELKEIGAAPLWRFYGNLFRKEPLSQAVPYHWSYERFRRSIEFFTGVMSLEEAERRVLMMVNPGLQDPPATLTTLFAGLQTIMPGETARPHRHTSNAFRFIIDGTGATTTVNGEVVEMRPGDLLLTPGWHWHDHVHAGDGPMYWLDGLDYPLVNLLEGSFAENLDAPRQEQTVPTGLSSRMFTHGRLNPAFLTPAGQSSPIGNYSWEQTQATFDAIGDDLEGSRSDGIILDYVNPWTGGPVMPTIGCRIARLRDGFVGQARRTSSNMIFHVVEGSGTTQVGDHSFTWQRGDTIAVPLWTWYRHMVAAGSHATLFSYTDEPVRRSLGFFREETREG
ncbi:cupin domain-containing protein [Sphingobium fuliginis]|uniref:Cupin domain-containing protein n=1 Tax=Sphingobium fuliginis ATCC 27551 TaxID=1208342 RepID=A0A5B8CKA8_SPHSA|nr:cupin domain-containing protein [Sphingobium fuliginis]QDC39649.1 cupin domain-containing protein [Sphingobium fuliginis ATCC 27551]